VEQPTRRTVLAAGILLGVGVVPGMKPLAADTLHRRAQALAAGGEQPAHLARKATNLLHLTTLATAVPYAATQSLHRTAALAALVGAQASSRLHRSPAAFLALAHGHAHAAGDGPLRAQALMLDAEAGQDGALAAALCFAGSSRSSATLRASIRGRLAVSYAERGDVHGSRLEAAAARVDSAAPSPDVLADNAASWVGSALARLARIADPDQRPALAVEAHDVLTIAVKSTARPSGALTDLALLRARLDPDDAASLLTDAYLAAVRDVSHRSRLYVRAAASTLPPCASTSALQDVLRG
jgi:hypothetical protein